VHPVLWLRVSCQRPNESPPNNLDTTTLGVRRCATGRKHGAENVTVLATMVGGPATNTIGLLATSEDWVAYGKAQQSLQGDPKFQEAMLAAGQIGDLGDVRQPDDPGHVTRHVYT
jgi:hypothetical protein